MRRILLLHILAGGLGLLSGYVALSAAKGAPLHRKSGMLFVCVMLTLSVTGMLISAVEGVAPAINIPSALLAFYLVITSLTTVRRPAAGARPLDIAAMLMALTVGLASVALGVNAIAGGGARAGMAYPLFLFGVVAFLASAGDLRMMRAGGLRGAPRLARHLWRMCFALFIASIAFFLGRGRVPEVIRTPALLAAGVLLPILSMAYWLWRVRSRRTFRGIAGVSTPQATALEARASL
jgi:uncharacterized membrane protein